MTDIFLQPAMIALCASLLAVLLGLAWLYRQLRQQERALRSARRVLQTLEAGKQQVEQANQVKNQFLGTVSHEIRTPLNAFIGLLERVVQRTPANADDRSALELALGTARDLRELLGDLLDLTRIESGQLSLKQEWTSLGESVRSVMERFQVLAQQKALRLDLELEMPDPEPLVLLDALRFKQVLSNLLSNAIKFTRQGEVRIRLQLLPEEHPGYFSLLLQVLDTGIGIPEQQRHHLLLHPFAQVDAANQSPRDSTGLGLPISHHLCQKMGGSLSLHGRDGPGSEARVRLALAGKVMPPIPTKEALPTHPHLPLNILVADDHPANRMLLQGQLEQLGHRVTCAEDGLLAYRLWKIGDFDLLIIDCNMPIMNGYQLARAIRRSENLQQRPAVTLLGCSACSAAHTVQRCREAGMLDCLPKPLGLHLLSQQLMSLAPLPRTDSFSIDALRTLTRGVPPLGLRMLEELLRCSHEDRQLLGRTPRDSPRELAALAHKIKGAALMVGAGPLQRGCQSLELACLDPAAAEQINDATRTLDLALVQFIQSLHRHIEAHPPPDLVPGALPEAIPARLDNPTNRG